MWGTDSSERAATPDARHHCTRQADHLGTSAGQSEVPGALYGSAVCMIERIGNRWWAHNEEYATEVSFCPWCGQHLAESET